MHYFIKKVKDEIVYIYKGIYFEMLYFTDKIQDDIVHLDK